MAVYAHNVKVPIYSWIMDSAFFLSYYFFLDSKLKMKDFTQISEGYYNQL